MSANEFYSSGEQGDYKPQQSRYQEGEDGQTGDRGLISTVVGGAAGGYAGDKLIPNHPHLGALAGVIGGAIGANKLEDAYYDHKQNKHGSNSGFGGRNDDRRGEGSHDGPGGPGGPGGPRGFGGHGGQGGFGEESRREDFGGERAGEGRHHGEGRGGYGDRGEGRGGYGDRGEGRGGYGDRGEGRGGYGDRGEGRGGYGDRY